MIDTMLIDTDSCLAAYDEIIGELVEAAAVMRDFASERITFGDVEDTSVQFVEYRTSPEARAQILSEAAGLDMAAAMIGEMRKAIDPS